MDREQVRRLLGQHVDELHELHMRSLSLFGSTVRGEAGADSDVDLLVEFDAPIGLFGFVRLQRRLAEILGRPVDLVPVDGVKARLRERIFAEAQRVA